MAIFRREPHPNGGVECRWGGLKSRFSTNIWHAINNCCTMVVYRTRGRLFVYCGYAAIGPPSATRDNQSPLSVALQCETDQARSRTIHNHGRPWIVCTTTRLDVTPETTKQNWIPRTGKLEAEVTNNKTKKTALKVLYYWSNEANYWQTRSIARPLCDSRATCFIIS